MPVDCGDGKVISVLPRMEFEASTVAVSLLDKLGLVQRLPDKKSKVLAPKTPKISKVAKVARKSKVSAPKVEKKLKVAPKTEKKKKEEVPEEIKEESGKPNRGFDKKEK